MDGTRKVCGAAHECTSIETAAKCAFYEYCSSIWAQGLRAALAGRVHPAALTIPDPANADAEVTREPDEATEQQVVGGDTVVLLE